MKLFVKWEKKRQNEQEGQTGRAAAAPREGEVGDRGAGRRGREGPWGPGEAQSTASRVGAQAQPSHTTGARKTVAERA